MLSIAKVNLDSVHVGAAEILSASVDLAILAAYEEIPFDGEPDLVVELIDLYLEDVPRRMAVMRAALSNSNWPSLKRDAHNLRGSSGNLGALQMALICIEIEEITSKELDAELEVLVSRLEQEFECVRHIFLAERGRRST